MSELLIGATIVVAGVLVGVEFCVAVLVNPIADRLPSGGGLTFRSSAGRLLGTVMPPWYIATVVLAVVSTVLLRSSSAGVLSGVAAALFVATIVLAVTVLVPINNRVKAWSEGDHPPDWRRQVQRWDRWHLLRVLLCTAGLILLVTAALTAP
ncbi:DUF1772 domain-containing protein [Ruania zhangjianzhongii]|uniref:DUF1772 domain-containing protein n=1 Tax=Ruania zhangjianzhongii TaxID=2603206 RepID=UPI0011C8EBFC|nr:DUF1772 domain-containing protein [Ruania zhangjianzhongii]